MPFQFNPDKTHEVFCPKCQESSIVSITVNRCQNRITGDKETTLCNTHLISVIRSMINGKPMYPVKLKGEE